ncbi:DgyrCDS12649 [Dimorphilus gyrociliatus]|uniref:Glycerate kinase n=1 Tax=Dimorphilus gyrociliatus TaxID=2664684 RepID=A0A7I8W813_9ANNE|nr:DgyrCDS12649 [Dimorphilus gyrociliatus]
MFFICRLNRNVHVIAAGKAVLGMVRATQDVLGDHIVGGIASVPYGIQETLKKSGKWEMIPKEQSSFQICEGAKNNAPDTNSLATSKKIHDLATSLQGSDIMLTLLSGGGSALLPLPKPPITLEEMREMVAIMVKHAATISDVNTVRKHTEVLKGGGLAYAAGNASVISLILSDIIGDPIDKIASGPTVTDFSKPETCMEIFRDLNVTDKIPKSIIKVVENEISEFSGHSALPVIREIYAHNVIVGNNKLAVSAANKAAEALGYRTFVLSTELCGEARDIGEIFAFFAGAIVDVVSGDKAKFDSKQRLEDSFGISENVINCVTSLAASALKYGERFCMLGAGETVVNLKGNGKGGRNGEIALSSALVFDLLSEKLRDYDINILSAGTDGQDGPTESAGAFSHTHLIQEAKEQNIDANTYLENNDTFHFFQKVSNGENLFVTGMTGTNVMDLHIMTVARKS